MRHELGLDLPERRIGLSAHDFAQLLGADDVILTPFRESRRRAGGGLALPAPAGSGRGRGALEAPRQRPATTMSASPTRSTGPTRSKPIAQPAPKPPRATRPLKLSVTAIEDWLRDPYTIYAKHILQARRRSIPSTCRCRPPIAARRSTMRSANSRRPIASEPARRSRARAARDRRKAFRAADGAARSARAVVAALPAHRRMVCRLGDRRGAATSPRIDAEISGEISIPLDNERTFTLSARADRIERRSDGSFAILDYKTGQPPTGKQVRMGLSPQLTLEAAILREGGFDGHRRRRRPSANSSMSGSAATIRRASSKIAGTEDQAERDAAAARRRRRLCARRSSKR